MIKPIETLYNGYRFRSRLEARWAVFFDVMGIKYQYEPEGYFLPDGTMYLPDFCIWVKWRGKKEENSPVFVEVKGALSNSDKHKIEQFGVNFCVNESCEIVDVIGFPLIVLGDIPKDDFDYTNKWFEDIVFHSFRYMDGDDYPALFSTYKGDVWITGADHDEWDLGKTMNCALLTARQARFEHGERGL